MPSVIDKVRPAEAIRYQRSRTPVFLVQLEPAPRVFFRNLKDLFRKQRPLVLSTPPGRFWNDVFVPQAAPRKGFAFSAIYHAGFVSIIYLTPFFALLSQQPVAVSRQHTTLTYYNVSEYLPPIKPLRKPAVAKSTRPPDPAYAAQPIISVPQKLDNLEQTIVDPSSVKLNQHVRLPNLMASTPVPAPPVAAVQRSTAALTLPTLAPQVVQPAPEAAARKLSQLNLPAMPQPALIEPAPQPDSMQRHLGDINLTRVDPNVQAPKMPVPEQRAATSNPENIPNARQEEVAPPALPAGSGGNDQKAVGQVLALGIRPDSADGPITLPGGNRSGEFEATPEGRPEGSGAPSTLVASNSRPNKSDDIHGLYVDGHGVSGNPGVVVAKPPAIDPARQRLLASLATPSVSELARRTRPEGVADPQRIEDEVFAGKRFYSLTLNMPNLTSASGSWVVRFAELNPTPVRGDLTAPVATAKVDPAYPADLMRDGVEGTVVLYAVIHTDGTVSEVRILRGFDSRLDENARLALSRWHFRPATKNGAAVDLEAVVQIPFRIRKIY